MAEFNYVTPKFIFDSENGIVEENPEQIDKFFDENNDLEAYCTHQDEDENDVFETPDAPRDTESRRFFRKSISMVNLQQLISYDTVDDVQTKTHHSSVNDKNKLHKNNYKSMSRDHLNKLALPKRCNSSGNLSNNPKNKGFVSMAEAVNKFQTGTPIRFRSKPLRIEQLQKPPTRTIPQSPKFATKTRARSVHVLSSKQLEDKEVEEMKQFKIKARPVNKKIFEGPVCPTVPVDKKPPTAVEPFNLTEAKNPSSKVSTTKINTEFHAKPIPKSTFNPPKPLINEKRHTVALTPQFSKRLQAKERKLQPVKAVPIQKSEPTTLTRTIPQPFSFEERNKQIIRHKEELVNKVLEEEKKAREFHARPLPKYIASSPKSRSKSSSLSSLKSEENNPPSPKFKAKPPVVLYKKPFEPVKPTRILTDITEFNLNTDKRAKERKEFEEKLQERMREQELRNKMMEEERMRNEEEVIQRLRKEAVHKAQPIKQFKKFEVHLSNKPLTQPIAPTFSDKK